MIAKTSHHRLYHERSCDAPAKGLEGRAMAKSELRGASRQGMMMVHL